MDYRGLIDTIVLKGAVRLSNNGYRLFSRTYPSNKRDLTDCAYTLPLNHTRYKHGDKTAELVRTQTYDGRIQVHTSKAFTAEYGYDLFMQVPPYLYYNTTRLTELTQKQKDLAKNSKLFMQIKIPSLHNLFLSPAFEDYLATRGDAIEHTDYAGLVWDYINTKTDLVKYGIEPYNMERDLRQNDLPIVQLDIAQNIRGPKVKDILELTSQSGFYARKQMRIWNNIQSGANIGSAVYQDPNGIEFRKGRKSSEIYKFYDKELQNAQTYYDAVYTARDFASNRSKRIAEDVLASASKSDRTLLRYEVSLRKVPSQRNAITILFARLTDGEEKELALWDILNNPIYSRVPRKILKDGLYNIFGSEIEKDITNFNGENTMTDTDILQEYGSKGLKYLGVKYLMDKGMSNDAIWKYLANAIRGNSSYEVVRRLRNEIRDDGIATKWNDGHEKTLDALRDIYKNSLA